MDFAQCVNSHSVVNREEDHSNEKPGQCQRFGFRLAAALPTVGSSGMLWAHRLQPAAGWGETAQLQINGGEGKKRSEVKQHLGVTHL